MRKFLDCTGQFLPIRGSRLCWTQTPNYLMIGTRENVSDNLYYRIAESSDDISIRRTPFRRKDHRDFISTTNAYSTTIPRHTERSNSGKNIIQNTSVHLASLPLPHQQRDSPTSLSLRYFYQRLPTPRRRREKMGRGETGREKMGQAGRGG